MIANSAHPQALTCIDPRTGNKTYIVVKYSRVIEAQGTPINPADLKPGGFYYGVCNTSDFRTLDAYLATSELVLEENP